MVLDPSNRPLELRQADWPFLNFAMGDEMVLRNSDASATTSPRCVLYILKLASFTVP